jgi:hypothetical protein
MMKPTFLKLEQKQLVSNEIKFELTIKQFQPTIFSSSIHFASSNTSDYIAMKIFWAIFFLFK